MFKCLWWIVIFIYKNHYFFLCNIFNLDFYCFTYTAILFVNIFTKYLSLHFSLCIVSSFGYVYDKQDTTEVDEFVYLTQESYIY